MTEPTEKPYSSTEQRLSTVSRASIWLGRYCYAQKQAVHGARDLVTYVASNLFEQLSPLWRSAFASPPTPTPLSTPRAKPSLKDTPNLALPSGKKRTYDGIPAKIPCVDPTIEESNSLLLPSGIQNEGNTCYIASLCQALNVVTGFTEHVKQSHVLVKDTETNEGLFRKSKTQQERLDVLLNDLKEPTTPDEEQTVTIDKGTHSKLLSFLHDLADQEQGEEKEIEETDAEFQQRIEKRFQLRKNIQTQLRKIFEWINGNDGVVTEKMISSFRKCIRKYSNRLVGNNSQEDPEEFYGFLAETLEVLKLSYSNEYSYHLPEELTDEAVLYLINELKAPEFLGKKIGGLDITEDTTDKELETMLQAKWKDLYPADYTEEKNHLFSLEIPAAKAHEGNLTLASLFHEQIQYGTETTKACPQDCTYLPPLPQDTVVVEKPFLTGSPPPFLPIQLKRYVNLDLLGRDIRRLGVRVEPDERLLIDVLKNKEVTQVEYELASVVVHRGKSLKGGHYIAYVKKEVDEQMRWIQCNDTRTCLCANNDEVIEEVSHNGYLFFYRLVSSI